MTQIQHFGEYTFEATHMVIMRGIDIIDLPQKQKEALALLLQAQGGIVKKETFLDTVWKGVIVEEHNVTQTIFLLRKTLGRLPNGHEYIETVPRKGYRLSSDAIQTGHVQPESPSPAVWVGHNHHHLTLSTSASLRMHPNHLFVIATIVVAVIAFAMFIHLP